MRLNKTVLNLAVSAALGAGAAAANAAGIDSFTFVDIDGDGTAGDFSFGVPPVIGGANSFNPLNAAGSLVPNSAARTLDEFTTGFQYSFYGEFHPYTYDAGLVGTITGTQDGNAANDTLTMSSVLWGGGFWPGGDSSQNVNFDLPPDPGTLTATIVSDNNDGTWDITLEWDHVIQDPGGDFHLQDAFWYTEFTVAADLGGGPPEVPVPAAAWLFGSGLVGLVGVARRRRSRKA
jgi:hypothetical protein